MLRAYRDITSNLTEAGYSDTEIAALAKETTFYADTRAAIKKHSGEELDIKPYEAEMRERAPAGWKSDTEGPKGSQVLNALFPIMSRDRSATQAIFEIIKKQPGY